MYFSLFLRNRTHYFIIPPHALFQDNCHLGQTLNYTLYGHPTLSLGRPPPWQDPSWEHSLLLEATHRVTLCHRSSRIYFSLFSPAARWLIQSDHVLMDDPKRSAAALRRIYHDASASDALLSSSKSDRSPSPEVF